MFLDQEADHAVVSHLNGCPYCLARANALGHTQHDLKGQYYRHSCPEPELLRDYEFGLLEPAESVQLSQHLALCPHCSRELLKYFQADLPAASIELFKNDQDSAKTRPDTQVVPINPAADLPRAFEQVLRSADEMFTRVRTFIAQLIPPDRLVPVYVRRAQSLDKQSFTFQADTLLIDLVVADKTKGALVKKLEGVLIGDIPERSQMNLWQNNQLFATAILDPGGDFIFDDLYPGIYELVVNSPTQKIYIPALVIS